MKEFKKIGWIIWAIGGLGVTIVGPINIFGMQILGSEPYVSFYGQNLIVLMAGFCIMAIIGAVIFCQDRDKKMKEMKEDKKMKEMRR